MYCFEALRCTKYDCPVQRNQVKRCWEYLEKLHGRAVTTEDCPFAPCSSCTYRLGWEIGLIGESLFPDTPDPTPESLMPLYQESAKKLTKEADTDTFSEEAENPNKYDSTRTEEPASDLIDLDDENLGKPGKRFCYELIDCPNPNCVVKRRQIIQCFRFFSRRSEEEKQQLTLTDRKCRNCFYKKGWDIGVISENLFSDIIEKRKLKIEKSDRIKQNTLVEIYLAELAKKPLSRDEEYELAKKIAGDSEASELFLLANLKLVTRIAKKYTHKGLGIMDLIQEGNIGLIKAISKFDFTLGYRFSTYAAYWVRYYMQRALAKQGNTIRIPHHLLTVANKIKRKIQEYEYANFCSPTLSELAKMLGLEEEKILTVIRITQTPISIHAKVGKDDEDETIEYYLTDKKMLSPEETALENLKKNAINSAIADLPERLRYIIENFYGFSEEDLSLAEIGRRLNVSRERARQLLHQALQKLQQNEFIKDFN